MYRAKLTVSKDFKFGETNKSADFLKKFPLGKVKITDICWQSNRNHFQSNFLDSFQTNELLL